MLSPTQALVFLLDVDNTLLDSDRFKLDLSARLLRDFGSDGSTAFWHLHAERIAALGYADHLGTVQAFRAGRDDDPLLLNLAEFLLEYPFAQRLFPRALEAVAHLGAFGQTVVFTDGDRVFQPRKLRRSGIWAAVEGRVMIPLQKQYALDAMQRRYPAAHYVMIDDKPLLLCAMKRELGQRLTTVFVQQGHYAQESLDLVIDPVPDVVIARIGALIDFDRSCFPAAIHTGSLRWTADISSDLFQEPAMSDDLHKTKIEPTPQEKKDGNLDPITDAPGAHPIGTAVGSAAGGAAGIAGGIAASAATGLATGTVMGGPVGAVVGLVAGAVVGGLAGKAVGEQIDPTVEDAYWRANHVNQPYAREGHMYDSYQSAYRTGYEGRSLYTGKTFEEAEHDLRKNYESNKGDSKLTWDGAKEAVRSAWNRLTGDSDAAHRKV